MKSSDTLNPAGLCGYGVPAPGPLAQPAGQEESLCKGWHRRSVSVQSIDTVEFKTEISDRSTRLLKLKPSLCKKNGIGGGEGLVSE